METPFTSTGFKPGSAASSAEEAFVGAAERFFELLRTFGMASGKVQDWSALAAPLASQFGQWLRLSQSVAPWFGVVAGTPAAAPFNAPLAWPFGARPLGPAAEQGSDAQRAAELFGRLAQLQGQLASHWSEIANTAAGRFVARLGTAVAPPTTPAEALKLYELWVSCAEEAYAATAHKDDFGRLQAELANTSAALLVEQRRQAETFVRALGAPSRSELDALEAQVKELRRQLAELAHLPRAPDTRSGEPAGPAPSARKARAARPRRAKRPASPASGKRGKARGPRR